MAFTEDFSAKQEIAQQSTEDIKKEELIRKREAERVHEATKKRINEILKQEDVDKQSDHTSKDPDEWLDKSLKTIESSNQHNESENQENEKLDWLMWLGTEELILWAKEWKNWWLMIWNTFVPAWHELIKKIQRFLMDEWYSIMDWNRKSSHQSIDGVVGNDTLDAILSFQREFKIKEETKERITAEWRHDVKWIFDNFKNDLENKWKEDYTRRSQRDIAIDVQWDAKDFDIVLSSYGRNVEIENNELLVNWRVFPIELQFTVDNADWEIMLDTSDKNKNMLYSAFKLANLLNWFDMFCQTEISNGKDLNLFIDSRWRICKEGKKLWIINETTIIDNDTLKDMANNLWYKDVKKFSKVLLDHFNLIISNQKDIINHEHRWNNRI